MKLFRFTMSTSKDATELQQVLNNVLNDTAEYVRAPRNELGVSSELKDVTVKITVTTPFGMQFMGDFIAMYALSVVQLRRGSYPVAYLATGTYH